MRALVRFLAALALLAGACVAHAASPGQRMVLLSGCPAQVQINGACPGVGFNFQTGTYYAQGTGSGPVTSFISTTRASSKYCAYANGLLTSVGNNVLCVTDQGALIEEARTNDALWSRDLTNAVWVAVTMTTALNATGADGTANSATTLTATAGNATVLQSITLGSQADTSSFYLKCVTCTGAIQITENNGGTWTACSGLVTTAFVQCAVTATLANPVVGLRIVNNGDVVVADFAQMEPGSFVTSPILTTTVAATRAADVPQLIGPAATAALPAKSAFFQTFGITGTTGDNRLFRDNAGVDYIVINSVSSIAAVSNGNAATATPGVGTTLAGTIKTATAMDSSSFTTIANAGTKATSANPWVTPVAPMTIGNIAAGTRALNGYMQRFALSPVKGAFDASTSP